jgi:hypothetical protein
MSWQRQPVAKALVAAIETQLSVESMSATVYDRPPFTVNAPAIVVGRPTEVRYSSFAISIDEVTLPLGCVGGADQDDTVAELIAVVRAACAADPSLGQVVQDAHVSAERSWRNVKLAGADMLVADAIVDVIM